MTFHNPSREEMKELLNGSEEIAVVGLSPSRDRVSYMVAEAMKQKGYRIIPVNPIANVSEILDETCYATLSDIPFPIDIVNVFRRSEHTPEVAEEAVKIGAKVLWLQLGIYSEEAAEIAEEAGLKVVMDRCIKVDAAKLLPNGKQR